MTDKNQALGAPVDLVLGLVERLRTRPTGDPYLHMLVHEAADELERLRGIVPEVLERLNDELCAENERLRAALTLIHGQQGGDFAHDIAEARAISGAALGPNA